MTFSTVRWRPQEPAGWLWTTKNQALTLGALRGARDELERAEKRLRATEDALASVPEDVAHDRLLDFALKLRETIRGRTGDDRTVEQVNRVLTELFSCFFVYQPGHAVPGGVGNELGEVRIEPSIRPEVAQRMIDADWPDPPMEWLTTIHKSGDTHA